MPDWVSELLRYGPLGVFAIGVCFAAWKMIIYAGHKLLDDGGFVNKWVDGEQKWRTALTERIEGQQDLCSEHASCIKALTESVKTGSEGSTKTNEHLARLVVLHEQGGDIGKATQTIEKNHLMVKQAIYHACEMCREVSAKELPGSAEQVAQHCAEIEKIIGQS